MVAVAFSCSCIYLSLVVGVSFLGTRVERGSGALTDALARLACSGTNLFFVLSIVCGSEAFVVV